MSSWSGRRVFVTGGEGFIGSHLVERLLREGAEVRALVHQADPDVIETIKRTDRPYFVLDGNICALQAAKDHVNVFLYDGAMVPDPDGIITSGHDNKTARTVAIRRGETINASALTEILRAIVANNRAGGWRKLKRETG